MDTARMVKIAKALADPTRQKMFQQIRRGGEVNCSQICAKFDLSQPTISHHLKLLVSAGLVIARREGTFHVMTADEGVLREFTRALEADGDAAPRPSRRPAPPAKPRKSPAKR